MRNYRKLVPISGALVAGLIGVAEACYNETSYVCAPVGTQEGNICLGNPPLCCPAYFAATDWIDWNVTYEYGTGNPLNLSVPVYCHGPAYYDDCDGIRRTIADVADPYIPYVYRPNYAQGCDEY